MGNVHGRRRSGRATVDAGDGDGEVSSRAPFTQLPVGTVLYRGVRQPYQRRGDPPVAPDAISPPFAADAADNPKWFTTDLATALNYADDDGFVWAYTVRRPLPVLDVESPGFHEVLERLVMAFQTEEQRWWLSLPFGLMPALKQCEEVERASLCNMHYRCSVLKYEPPEVGGALHQRMSCYTPDFQFAQLLRCFVDVVIADGPLQRPPEFWGYTAGRLRSVFHRPYFHPETLLTHPVDSVTPTCVYSVRARGIVGLWSDAAAAAGAGAQPGDPQSAGRVVRDPLPDALRERLMRFFGFDGVDAAAAELAALKMDGGSLRSTAVATTRRWRATTAVAPKTTTRRAPTVIAAHAHMLPNVGAPERNDVHLFDYATGEVARVADEAEYARGREAMLEGRAEMTARCRDALRRAFYPGGRASTRRRVTMTHRDA